jgi:hypothetical protein
VELSRERELVLGLEKRIVERGLEEWRVVSVREEVLRMREVAIAC